MTRSPEPHRRYSWAHSSLGGYTDGEHLAESEISRSRKRYAYYDLDSPIGPRPLTRTRPNGLKPAPVDDLFRKSVRGPRQISYESETDTPNKHGERKRTGRDPREDRKNDGSSTPTVTKAGTARPPAESPAEPDPMHIQMLAELEKETRPRAEANTVVSVPTFGFALPTVKPESPGPQWPPKIVRILDRHRSNRFGQWADRQYGGRHLYLYPDGSASDGAAGAGIAYRDGETGEWRGKRIPLLHTGSSDDAEAMAMEPCFKIAVERSSRFFTVLTDSLATLMEMEGLASLRPVSEYVKERIRAMKEYKRILDGQGKRIECVKIKAHAEKGLLVVGNEHADAWARNARIMAVRELKGAGAPHPNLTQTKPENTEAHKKLQKRKHKDVLERKLRGFQRHEKNMKGTQEGALAGPDVLEHHKLVPEIRQKRGIDETTEKSQNAKKPKGGN